MTSLSALSSREHMLSGQPRCYERAVLCNLVGIYGSGGTESKHWWSELRPKTAGRRVRLGRWRRGETLPESQAYSERTQRWCAPQQLCVARAQPQRGRPSNWLVAPTLTFVPVTLLSAGCGVLPNSPPRKVPAARPASGGRSGAGLQGGVHGTLPAAGHCQCARCG